ncbi:MAG: serine hydrolase domain-containing protein, partial [Gemmatimonadota bacterium]|nr:serine hydrolase domain-containing protein [Gemmatimonadota bacterium]
RTVFRVGSNSKTLTAAAVLTLLEDGRVDLDTDINEYLTRVRVPNTYPEEITLRHLLTHTAGLDERLFGQHARTREEALSLEEYLAEKLPPRTGPPGAVISYNDHGTSLAGLVVEEVSGQPFAEYVADRIFDPLGMTLSSFDIANLPPSVRGNLATAYRSRDGAYEPYDYDYIQTAPAAGLVTTATDMGRFMLALLGGGRLGERRVLSDSMTAVMLSRQFAHDPRLRGRAFGFAEVDENGVRGLSKDGQATGFLSRIFLLPDAGIGFFASINLSIFFNRASGFHRRLTTAILDRYFMPDSAYFDRPEAPAPDPSFDAGPYVGTYRNMEGSRHTIEKILFLGDETRVRDGGDGTILVNGTSYVQLEPGRFQYEGGGPYYLSFRLGDDGLASHLFMGAGAEERAPWHDTARTTMIVLAVTGLSLLSAILVWAFAGLFARLRGRPAGDGHPGRRVLVAAAALSLGFLVGFGWIFSRTDFQEFFKGVPPAMAALLTLPVAVVPLTAVTVVHTLRAWRSGRGSIPGRIHYSLVSAALVLFLLLLDNWHMLGWRY